MELKTLLKNFLDALEKVKKHFDEKQIKALDLLLEPDFTELVIGKDDNTAKMLAYGYLIEKDIRWEHSDFEYPVEFEAVWQVYNFEEK